MKNKILLALSALFLLFQSCGTDESPEFPEESGTEQLTKTQINDVIFKKITASEDFKWDDLDNNQLWSAILLSDNLVTIAWDFNAEDSTEKQRIIDFIYESEGKSEEDEDVITDQNDYLKILTAKIERKETFLALRKMQETKAIDPFYEIFSEEEVSEGLKLYSNYLNEGAPTNKNQDTERSVPITPALGYNVFYNHNIPAAWQKGLTGRGIRVAIVDGGIKKDDGIFGISGNQQASNPHARSVQKDGRYKKQWYAFWRSYDGAFENGFQLPSGHGTGMMKIIGAPSTNGAGVAYNTNLISVRSSNSVWIDLPANVRGVTKAFEYLSNRSDVKIISMSQGGLINWTSIRRAIQKCHNKGKLILTAGGTFPFANFILSTVANSPGALTLFPARLSEVISVTGIKNTNSIEDADWCDTCFGKADFVVEFDSNGSSSESTATTAGMAALIWARNPSLSRDEVMNKMRAASDRPENRHYYFGYGRVDMQRFVQNEGL